MGQQKLYSLHLFAESGFEHLVLIVAVCHHPSVDSDSHSQVGPGESHALPPGVSCWSVVMATSG